MKISIATKLNLLICVLMVALGISLGWFVVRHETEALKEELRVRGNATAQHLAVYCEFGIITGDTEELTRILEGIIKEKDISFVSITDKDGQTIVHSESGHNSKIWDFTVPVTTQAQPDGIEELEIFSQAPESDGSEEIIGHVRMGMSLSELKYKVEQVKRIIFGMVTLLMFITAVLAYLGIKHFIKRPLQQIISGIQEIGSGDLSSRIVIRSRDELGEVGSSFNAMAEELSNTLISKTFLDDIFQSMMDTLIVLNGKGMIKMANRATSTLLGYSEGELVGMPMSSILQTESAPEEPLAQGLPEQLSENVERIYTTKSGREIPVILSGAAIAESKKGPHDIVCVARDITELKETQMSLADKNEKLQQINTELDQFAYVVSHDLKAPLRAIANLTQWIKEDLGETASGDIREQLDLLRGRANRMEALIQGVLELSRIGRTDSIKEPVDLNELIKEIVDSLPVPEGFQVTIAPDMPVLLASRTQLTQVFSNLIGNAIKHCNCANGQVEVTVREKKNCFEFAVIDNGQGIAPQYHQKIFGIFQTLQTRDQLESTGVGLTVVKKILEEQNSYIKVESEEGKGATFRFGWPITNAKKEE